MPKYNKRRALFRNYGTPALAVNQMVSMAPPFLAPLFPPMPILSSTPFPYPVPPTLPLKPGDSDNNRRVPDVNNEVQKQEDFSLEDYACLPNFHLELDKTKDREPTDIIIIDFDRTLLSTPNINKDLITKAGRQILETKLPVGSRWWQSHLVLKLAIQEAKWNATLLDIARLASSSDNALLVLTTSRVQADLPLILESLSAQGIDRVDHFSCTHSCRRDEELVSADDEKPEGVVGNSKGVSNTDISVGADSKAALIELLLETYDTLERLMIFDGNQTDANSYSRKASQFVQQGWLNAEAIYVADLVLKPHILPFEVERKLMDEVLTASRKSDLFVKSVVVNGWVHKVTLASRKRIHDELKELNFDYFDCTGMQLAGSSLPPDMRWLANDLLKTKSWEALKYQVKNKQATIFLVEKKSNNQNAGEFLPQLPLKLGTATINDCIVQLPQPFDVETIIYEDRKLDILKKHHPGHE